MATIKKFEDIEVWQKARQLCNLIYPLTLKGSFAHDYKLRDQINGSSGSVMNNIAEGFGRRGNKEFANFLSIAIGSCCEVQSQLYRALDRKYIDNDEFKECYDLTGTIILKSRSLINYLNKSEYTGKKYKDRTTNDKRQTTNNITI